MNEEIQKFYVVLIVVEIGAKLFKLTLKLPTTVKVENLEIIAFSIGA